MHLGRVQESAHSFSLRSAVHASGPPELHLPPWEVGRDNPVRVGPRGVGGDNPVKDGVGI